MIFDDNFNSQKLLIQIRLVFRACHNNFQWLVSKNKRLKLHNFQYIEIFNLENFGKNIVFQLMEAEELVLDYMDQKIYVELIKFGKSIYCYVGPNSRSFTFLSAAMPNNGSSTCLLGNNIPEDLSFKLTEITHCPVLLSYNFPMDSEEDFARQDFIKIQLVKYFKK